MKRTKKAGPNYNVYGWIFISLAFLLYIIFTAEQAEEAVVMVQEMVKLPVKVIKDRKLVQELQDLVLKVVSCHCIEDCQREGLQTSTAKILLELV